MTFGTGIIQSHQMKLALSVEMRQGLHILQFTSAELISYIQEQLSENPLLEEKQAKSSQSSPFIHEKAGSVLETVPQPEASLEEILLEQLSFSSSIPASTRRIAKYIIGNLNDSGYLLLSAADIVGALGATLPEVEEALALVRRFEPAGIAACSLKECLLAQLLQFSPRHALAEQLVAGYLDELAGGSRAKLAGKLRVTPLDIQQALAVIRLLNPRPGSAYSREQSRYIISDLIVRKTEQGFEVHVNEGIYPKLSINSSYEGLLHQLRGGGTAHEKAYVRDRLHSGRLLIQCMRKRHVTLRRVAQAMLERQLLFLERGPGYLQPMTMKEIAVHVGLHESTVSRAVSGKYIRSPWGVIELKRLFSNQVTDIGSISQEAIKARIKLWILGENPAKPYSDQQLADRLAGEGMKIARRTVSKYREELGIFSSSQRQA